MKLNIVLIIQKRPLKIQKNSSLRKPNNLMIKQYSKPVIDKKINYDWRSNERL